MHPSLCSCAVQSSDNALSVTVSFIMVFSHPKPCIMYFYPTQLYCRPAHMLIKAPQIQCCALLKYPLPKKLVHFKFILELGLCSLLDSQHCYLPGSYYICPNSATNWGPSIPVSEPMGHIFPHLNHCKRQTCVHILENDYTQTVLMLDRSSLRGKGSVLAQGFRGLVYMCLDHYGSKDM